MIYVLTRGPTLIYGVEDEAASDSGSASTLESPVVAATIGVGAKRSGYGSLIEFKLASLLVLCPFSLTPSAALLRFELVSSLVS